MATLYHADVATTCTASMLVSWTVRWDQELIDNKNTTKANKIAHVKAALDEVKNLVTKGFKQDFDLIFSIVTDSQHKTCKEFMEKIGMTKVYEGRKDLKGVSRHRESGVLHMYTVHPVDYKEAVEKFKAYLEELLVVLDPPMVADPERAKFPDMILANFYGNGIIRKKAEGIHRIRTGCTDMEKFKALLSMKFGTDFSDEDSKFLSVPLEEASFDMLLGAQKRWKEDKIILLSDLQKRKAA